MLWSAGPLVKIDTLVGFFHLPGYGGLDGTSSCTDSVIVVFSNGEGHGMERVFFMDVSRGTLFHVKHHRFNMKCRRLARRVPAWATRRLAME